jgi:ADP-ribose pyrophosphatase YjhB (NUDIX family)
MSSDTKDSAVVVITREAGLDSFFTYLTPEGKLFAGRYRLPGGKLKPGEDYGSALSRELREEYGVELLDIQLHYKKPNVLGGTIYLCSAQEIGEPTPLEKDVGAVEWKTARGIFESNMVPNCKIALCAYLLDSKPDAIRTWYPIIMNDQEFFKIVTSEATGLYERLNL